MRGSRTKLAAAVLSALVTLPSTTSAQGQDPWMGTWKLNVAKSRFSPGPAPKSNTLKIEPVAGGAVKHTFDGVNAQGQTTHADRVGKFDGVEIPVENVTPPTQTKTTNSFRKLDGHSFEVVSRVAGKVTTTTRVVISADGKTMTQSQTGTNAQGQKVDSVQVYDKQ